MSDGEQNGIAEDESMKALVCWRNTAEKQELEVIFLNLSLITSCLVFKVTFQETLIDD